MTHPGTDLNAVGGTLTATDDLNFPLSWTGGDINGTLWKKNVVSGQTHLQAQSGGKQMTKAELCHSVPFLQAL